MPCSFPLPYSFSPSNSTTPNNSYLIYAKASPTTTTTFVKGENIEQPNNGEVKRNRTLSKSYSAKKSAILEIQLSPDLDSTLTSYGNILKVQDLNAILHHFGMRKRWHKLSQLLLGCIKAKQGYPIAMELVQELQQNDVQMDNVIYGTLLAICASHNKLSEAESYFNWMKEEGHSPNIFHYSSLLNAYSICGDYKKADILIQDMESTGLPPNKVILTTLLKVYVRGGLFEKSRELLAELQTKGYAEDEADMTMLEDKLPTKR